MRNFVKLELVVELSNSSAEIFQTWIIFLEILWEILSHALCETCILLRPVTQFAYLGSIYYIINVQTHPGGSYSRSGNAVLVDNICLMFFSSST